MSLLCLIISLNGINQNSIYNIYFEVDLGAPKTHRKARWVLPYQARFKIFSCLISNSSNDQEFIQNPPQFQARSEILKSRTHNFKQDQKI